MRDGYYLSTYLHIDEIAHLTDLRVRHDQNISLWQKNSSEIKLIHYWELERVTGIKKNTKSLYNVEQAKKIVNILLSKYNLKLDDMIEVWGTLQLQTSDDYHSLDEYPELSYHSIAHLFSAILMDSEKFNNENIIGLAVDGGPDGAIDYNICKKSYYSGCLSINGKLQVFPVYSPGFIWTFARKRYQLQEGTLMALASASTSELYTKNEDELILVDCVDDLPKAYKYVSKLADKVDSLTEGDSGKLFNGFDPRFSEKENKISMVIKEIQKMSIRIMEKNLDDIIEKYGVNSSKVYLALAGGYVLNCPTNSYLMQKYNFKGFMAPPCVSDTGISLGIALYAFYKKLGKFDFKFAKAYYGNKDETLEEIIGSGKYSTFIKKVTDLDYKQAVSDISKYAIVWFDGASEIGPRALGHRSIIADPRTSKAKDELNIVKQRQWWRPVAPIVIEEDINKWFESAYPSPYMLHTFQIKPEKLAHVPAIAHLDNSARVQTINEDDDSRLYSLVKAFKEETGVPIICNTSLNDCGEPIIDRIEEALNFALRKNIKVVYLNGKRVELQNHSDYLIDSPLERVVSIYNNDIDKEEALKKYNPYGISRDILMFYYLRPELKEKYDIRNEEDVRRLKMYAKVAFEKLGLAAIPGV